MEKLWRECEKTKCLLSTQHEVIMELNSDFSVSITRDIFENLCNNYFKQCIECISKVLMDAKMGKYEIDEILLLGGSTKIPKIREMISVYFDNNNRENLFKSVPFEHVIAKGASIVSGILCNMSNLGNYRDLIWLDVYPISLGFTTNDGIVCRLIERQKTIPCKVTEYFSSNIDVNNDNTKILIKVFAGERQMTKDNDLLGTFEIIGTCSSHPYITFVVDDNGILQILEEAKNFGGMGIQKKKLTIHSRFSGKLLLEEVTDIMHRWQTLKIQQEKLIVIGFIRRIQSLLLPKQIIPKDICDVCFVYL
eukprot:147406_1